MPNQYVLTDGYQNLQLENGALVPVTAPLGLDAGMPVALIPIQLAILTELRDRMETLTEDLLGTAFNLLAGAPDLTKTFSYLDPDTVDERISAIVYDSASLDLTVTETFAYAGAPGGYRLSTITRS